MNGITDLLQVEEVDGRARTDVTGVNVVLTMRVVHVDALILQVVLVDSSSLDGFCICAVVTSHFDFVFFK